MEQSMQSVQGPIGSELIEEDPSFADIVVQFVEGLGGRLEAMEQALRVADFDALRTAAHQLKGSGGGYGYPLLTAEAATLELFAKDGMLDDCASALASLKELCTRVVVSPHG